MRLIGPRILPVICLWALLAQLALCPVVSAAALSVTVVSVDASAFPKVSAIVNVLNPQGVPVNGLTKQQLTVLEDDKVVDIEVKPTVDPQEAIAIALVFDISGSMAEEGRIDSAKQAANALIDTMTARDTMAIITFSDAVDPVVGFTNDKARLKTAIAGLKPKGATLLYDAVSISAKLIGATPQRRKILLVLTDGEDETSKQYTLDSAAAAARDSRAPVFAVGLGKGAKREPLEKLARDTAGQASFVDNAEQLKQTFLSYSEQLRRQYQIQYTSSLVGDGKPHSLTVRVNVQSDSGEGKGSFTPAAPTARPAPTGTATVTVTRQPATVTPTSTSVPAKAIVTAAPVATPVPTPTPCSGLSCTFGPQTPLALILGIILVALALLVWFLIRLSRPFGMEVKGLVDGVRVRRGDVLQLGVTITSGRARRVELLVDDQLCATAPRAPYAFEWDSDEVREGQHRVVVRAIGIVGAIERAFNITKADDVTLVESQVRFDVRGIRDGEQVSGQARIEVVVTRGTASRVELLVDGRPHDERRTPPFVFTWDPRGLTDRHQLTFRVTDAQGTVSERVVNVTVDGGTVLADLATLHGDEAAPAAPVVRPKLEIVFRGQRWQHELTQPETLIGRKARDAAAGSASGAVLFDDPQRLIHREHARILREADRFYIENLGEKGTKVNGRPISQKRELANGDIIEVCDAVLKFTVEVESSLDTLPGTGGGRR